MVHLRRTKCVLLLHLLLWISHISSASPGQSYSGPEKPDAKPYYYVPASERASVHRVGIPDRVVWHSTLSRALRAASALGSDVKWDPDNMRFAYSALFLAETESVVASVPRDQIAWEAYLPDVDGLNPTQAELRAMSREDLKTYSKRAQWERFGIGDKKRANEIYKERRLRRWRLCGKRITQTLQRFRHQFRNWRQGMVAASRNAICDRNPGCSRAVGRVLDIIPGNQIAGYINDGSAGRDVCRELDRQNRPNQGLGDISIDEILSEGHQGQPGSEQRLYVDEFDLSLLPGGDEQGQHGEQNQQNQQNQGQRQQDQLSRQGHSVHSAQPGPEDLTDPRLPGEDEPDMEEWYMFVDTICREQHMDEWQLSHHINQGGRDALQQTGDPVYETLRRFPGALSLLQSWYDIEEPPLRCEHVNLMARGADRGQGTDTSAPDQNLVDFCKHVQAAARGSKNCAKADDKDGKADRGDKDKDKDHQGSPSVSPPNQLAAHDSRHDKLTAEILGAIGLGAIASLATFVATPAGEALFASLAASLGIGAEIESPAAATSQALSHTIGYLTHVSRLAVQRAVAPFTRLNRQVAHPLLRRIVSRAVRAATERAAEHIPLLSTI
ncbi:uncharacterized protein MAM_02613 [Metarhizium album ARSEF 1941]|uniref:Uncharacterized protein n=1 Tax=Metarhizium album (strain ARSEF 1941) TaxID=1081103 RepID=A0A0B2X398_METAS|nr:uncharacterized protein MAM_02613 [Metarhizium album ARSEF 1941]KHN99760.1 hypothetical protein MAM_02613 [Metarhizium album ARSEF 1941]